MEYRCKKCNLQHSITYNKLLQNRGCPRCANTKRSEHKKLSYEFVKQQFNNKGIELLDKTYVNSNAKLKCKCRKCNLIYYVTYGHLSQGVGCPRCASSKGEKQISKFCRHNNISFKQQYSFNNLKYKYKLRFDFGILRNYKLIFLIEFNGKQHYRAIEYFGGEQQLKSQQYRDHLKSTYCLSHGIPLHIIRYDEDTTGRLNEIFQDYFGERIITKVKRLFSA